ncbi:hypothetical protein PR001_g24123, partial [Phytophthora rubi]
MRLLCSVWIVAALATLVAGIDVGPKSNTATLARNDNEVHVTRLLRIANEEEEDEERGGLDKFSGFVKAKVSKSTDKLRLQLRRAKTGSGEEFFSLLKLDKMGVNLFDSPSKVKAWAKYMAVVHRKNPEEAMIASLRARYSDDVLAKMLVEAKRMPKSAQIAGKLEAAQIQVWMKSHETVDDIFALLKLDEAGGDVSLTYQVYIRGATTAADSWRMLEEQFNRNTLKNRLIVTKKLHNFKMESGTRFAVHVDQFKEIVLQMETVGEPLDETRQLVLLLGSLTDEYRMISTVLENTPNMTLAYAIQALSGVDASDESSSAQQKAFVAKKSYDKCRF